MKELHKKCHCFALLVYYNASHYHYSLCPEAVPWFTLLVTCLNNKPDFEYRPSIRVGFVVDKMVKGQFFSWNNSYFHCQYHKQTLYYRRHILII